VVLIAALQMVAVFNPAVVEVDPEEMFNAGQAWMLAEGHLADLFRLQYRDYCGGCSLNALLGAGAFSLFGRSWLAWKVVPLVFVLALAVLGSRGLHRLAGRPAAWAFLLLLALPPRAWMFLSVIGWGNHYEAGCVALCGLVLLLRVEGSAARAQRAAVLAGAVLGLASWIGFSGCFALLAALFFLLLTGRRAVAPKLLLGASLGLFPWALQWWSTGLHPFVTVYEGGESAPSLLRVPYKLSTLLRPRQLVALFGSPHSSVGWGLAWAWAGSLAIGVFTAVRGLRSDLEEPLRRAFLAVLLFLGCWIAIYCVVRFQVYDPPDPEIAYPSSARYAAPLYPLAFFLLSLAFGFLWSSGRRGVALLLLLAPLTAGGLARLESMKSPFPAPSVYRLEAVDWEYFRPSFGYRIPEATLHRQPSEDKRAQQVNAYALGREQTASILRTNSRDLSSLHVPPAFGADAAGEQWPRSWWEGVGEAVGKHLDSAEHFDGSAVVWPELLSRAEELLESVPGSEGADWDVALRAAAALEEPGRVDWIKVQGGWDRAALPSLATELSAVSPRVARASWHAHGRACGAALARFHLPGRLELGRALPGLPPSFFLGLGRALGERWGPMDLVPRPRGLPVAGERSLVDGFDDGVARRWLGGAPGAKYRLSGEALQWK